MRAIAAGLLLVVACSSSKSAPPPTCENAVDNLNKVEKAYDQQTGTYGSGGSRADMIAACESQHRSEAELRCEVSAPDLHAYYACAPNGPGK